MGKYKYLAVHCLDTTPDMYVDKAVLEQWHMGPKDLDDGRVIFLGKIYASRDDLPDSKLNGVAVSDLHGRGWSRLGYSGIIHRGGAFEVITPYDQDDDIDLKEMTWGIKGYNGITRHFALEGGHNCHRTDRFGDNYTLEQMKALSELFNLEIEHHPGLIIVGHYQLDPKKECPAFDVPEFLKLLELSDHAFRE